MLPGGFPAAAGTRTDSTKGGAARNGNWREIAREMAGISPLALQNRYDWQSLCEAA